MVLRPTFNETWMQVAFVVAQRSTCIRHKLGAVIIKDNNLLSTGYNGAANGIVSCDKKGFCLKDKLKQESGKYGDRDCHAVHAEVNAIIRCGWNDLQGSTLFTIMSPCHDCAKIIINSGIKQVYYAKEYDDKRSFGLFFESDVTITGLNICDYVEKQWGEIKIKI